MESRNRSLNQLTFKQLISSIEETDSYFKGQASRAVNVSLTLRNWVIGCYVSEYELNGKDRAKYGENLIGEVAKELGKLKVSNVRKRQLYDYINLFKTYPQIVGTLFPRFRPQTEQETLNAKKSSKVRRVPAQFKPLSDRELQASDEKVPTVSAQSSLPPDQLITMLSYSMLKLLIEIDDPLKRAFYEIECTDPEPSPYPFYKNE